MSASQPHSSLTSPLPWWKSVLLHLVQQGEKHPWKTIAISFLITVVSCYYVKNNLGINTDTADMLSDDLPYRKSYQKYKEAFPKEVDTILIVIESTIPEIREDVTKELATILRKTSIFKDIFLPSSGIFFDRYGLLYLSLEELENLVDTLSVSQPLLSQLSRQQNLKGLSMVLQEALDYDDNEEIQNSFHPFLEEITRVIQASLDNESLPLSWQNMLHDSSEKNGRQYIILQPKLNFEHTLPAQEAMETIQSLVSMLETKHNGQCQIYITGEVALGFEELNGVQHSMKKATMLSLFAVVVTLWIAFGSLRLVIATGITLVVGLLLTFGVAAIAIGHLNLISLAFTVLYIGLGVDYAIHFILHYKEETLRSSSFPLRKAAEAVSPSLVLCALSTAVGFYSFLSTDYTGVSELGFIAGSGILLNIPITFSLLPAILSLIPISRPRKPCIWYRGLISVKTKRRFIPWIRWTIVILTMIGITLLSQAKFDYHPMNLRNPNAESVRTFQRLQEDGYMGFPITVLAKGKKTAKKHRDAIRQLKGTKQVITVFDYIPEEQEEKFIIIEDMELILGSLSSKKNNILTFEEKRTALQKFSLSLKQYLSDHESVIQEKSGSNFDQLQHILQAWLLHLDGLKLSSQQHLFLQNLENQIFGFFPDMLEKLQQSIPPEPITMGTLPDILRERWVSKQDLYRIEVISKYNPNDKQNLENFLRQVSTFDQGATGGLILAWKAGETVIGAFHQAFILASLMIFMLLWFTLRSSASALLVMLPLVLTALYTTAIAVVGDVSFNFANIITLPLLFGLGVDNGIHMMRQIKHIGVEKSFLSATSTNRSIFFSGMTTLVSFSTLTFVSHVGISTMGKLLTWGIIANLFCTLILFPAFFSRSKPCN